VQHGKKMASMLNDASRLTPPNDVNASAAAGFVPVYICTTTTILLPSAAAAAGSVGEIASWLLLHSFHSVEQRKKEKHAPRRSQFFETRVARYNFRGR
jgi:hypothetical protein